MLYFNRASLLLLRSHSVSKFQALYNGREDQTIEIGKKLKIPKQNKSKHKKL